MSRDRHSVLVIALISLAGFAYCGTPKLVSVPPVADGGTQIADASEGTPDVGGWWDLPDAGPPDAGTMIEDAGTVEDAGTTVIDAGVVDAGTPFVRFVAIGDFGKGNDKQYAVGAAMANVCAARGGCHFGLTLGDNFYPSGVSSVTDPVWQNAFELPYKDLNFRFYASLGNHDYGNDGTGTDLSRAKLQIAYTANSTKWFMPANHYTFTEGPIDFVALDMNAIFIAETPLLGSTYPDIKAVADDEKAQMPARFAAMKKPWKIAFGHHPYLSNGDHGNAGWYDSVPTLGNGVKSFVEGQIKGKFDVYLAGHDHSMQDLGEVGGTQFLVAGAGSSTTAVRDPSSFGANPSKFQSDESGFLLVEATDKQMTFKFFDSMGAELHSRTITK